MRFDAVIAFTLELPKKLLLAGMVAMLSVSSLTMMTKDELAAPDKFGIEQLYPTAGDGPVWFLNNEDPEDDDNFLMTSAEDIELEEEEEEEEEVQEVQE